MWAKLNFENYVPEKERNFSQADYLLATIAAR